jgi:hypothetical protein
LKGGVMFGPERTSAGDEIGFDGVMGRWPESSG